MLCTLKGRDAFFGPHKGRFVLQQRRGEGEGEGLAALRRLVQASVCVCI